VPEAIVARQCGLRVAGLSCITNLAAGRGQSKLSHKDVLEAGESAKPAAGLLLEHFTELYGRS
jgi:purine nucleoside phosphorylase